MASPDVETSHAFYGGLFGWTGEPSTDPEAGGYMVFMQGDTTVAGLGPVVDGIPPHWSVYVTVADIDETATNALAAGGQVLTEPMDVCLKLVVWLSQLIRRVLRRHYDNPVSI